MNDVVLPTVFSSPERAQLQSYLTSSDANGLSKETEKYMLKGSPCYGGGGAKGIKMAEKFEKYANGTVDTKSLDSPSKNSSRLNYDRFIPSQYNIDIKSNHYSLAAQKSEVKLDTRAMAQQDELARACGIKVGQKILTFGTEAPVCDREDFKKLYTSKAKKLHTGINNKRRILTSAEQVLDAPGLVDDYYLNLLDWSVDNMLAIGLERNVYLWDASSGEVTSLCETSGPSNTVCSLQWTNDGEYLAVGNSEGVIELWDVNNKKKMRSMKGRLTRVGVLSWNNHILSSGGQDGCIWNHDVRVAKHKVAELVSHTGEVCGLKWREDGGLLASGGNDNMVNVWDIRSSVPRFTKSDHTAAVKAIAWSPHQPNVLATGGGSNDKFIRFWNTTTAAQLGNINTGSQVTSLVWSKHYKEIASTHGYPDNVVTLWSYPDLSKIIDIPAHDTRILHSSISPDGQVLATLASDENLKFWRLFENTKKGASNTRGAHSDGAKQAGAGWGKGENTYHPYKRNVMSMYR
ncbi:WD repeat-containing protein slp1 [Zancudomyces culisetae]|uniref:WD repeat-containing protein slp1 n=1 Tax=Zancudomyces culisetae TaxID=1213189 RepID=A0A1R1PKV6_ZANCU|nr:WD repeat-containing protein slp1 [Zancudomyces culisetae]|eukprot:OMH81595.1 WD repeat-containing protein slp1 [Zancudomyces culisetae]